MIKHLALILLAYSLGSCTYLTNSLDGIETLSSTETSEITPNPPNQTPQPPATSEITSNLPNQTPQPPDTILSFSETRVEETADIYVSNWGRDQLNNNNDLETETSTVSQTIFVSATGSDQMETAELINISESYLLYVSEKGNDHQITSLNDKNGSQDAPFRSLTFAIVQAQRLQAGDSSKIITIQIDAGTYSPSSGENQIIDIPPGIIVKGVGEETIILSSIYLRENNELSNLQIKNSQLYIESEDNSHQAIKVNNIYIDGLGIIIENSSPKLSQILIKGERGVSHANFDGNAKVAILGSNPQITDLKIQESEVRGIYINSQSAPNFKNVEIQSNQTAILNRGNSTFQNLNINNNSYGISNEGEMTIENLTITNSKYAGICNFGTMLIKQLNIGGRDVITVPECPSDNEEPPIVIPDIAGDVDSVKY